MISPWFFNIKTWVLTVVLFLFFQNYKLQFLYPLRWNPPWWGEWAYVTRRFSFPVSSDCWLAAGRGSYCKTASNTKDLCCIKVKITCWILDRPADYTRNHKRQYVKLWIATLNVGTMRELSTESVQMLSWYYVDIWCVQESHWKGKSAQNIMGKNIHYKFFWKRDQSGHGD